MSSLQQQTALFDYTALDAEARIVIQQRAGEIKTLAKRVNSDIIEVGGKLAEVKDRLANSDRYKAWLESEFGWSERTAYNFIGVYQRFGQSEFQLEKIATSALYLLAAPSTPAEAIREVQVRVEAGQKITHTEVKEIVAKVKEKAPKQKELIAKPEPVPQALPVINVSTAQLDEIDGLCVTEFPIKRPVKLHNHQGTLYVITGTFWIDQDSDEPETEFGARGFVVQPEEQAPAVVKPAPVGGVESLIGDRINAGSAKKPEWYVIVGPEVEFRRHIRRTAKPAATATPTAPEAPIREEAESSPVAPKAAYGQDFSVPELMGRIEISIVIEAGSIESRRVEYAVRAGSAEQHYAEKGMPLSMPLPFPLKQILIPALIRELQRNRAEMEHIRCDECGVKEGHKATCRHYQTGTGTPIETELPGEELDRIAKFACVAQLSSGKPVRLCYVDIPNLSPLPFVITGAAYAGGGATRVYGYEALPMGTDDKPITYQEAMARHQAQLAGEDAEPFSYENVKVNVGSVKKPDWWVMVGKKVEFTLFIEEVDNDAMLAAMAKKAAKGGK